MAPALCSAAGVPAKKARQEKAQQPAPEPANGAEKPVKEKKQKEKAPKLRCVLPWGRRPGAQLCTDCSLCLHQPGLHCLDGARRLDALLLVV